MMGDDGEKFGAWPTTYEHCWGGGRWVERFFEALEANARLADDRHPVALAGARAADRPRLRPDRPRTRRWASGRCRRTRPSCSRGCCTTPWRRTRRRRAGCAAGSGATSRSSTARSTTSTSRCCGRRARWRRCRPGPERTRALDHLYRGQSNDCYWHGLFGGIYIAHMRLATLEHLIAAEDAADALPAARRASRPSCCDLDMDGRRRGPARGRRAGRDRQARPRARASAAGTSGPSRHALAAVLRRRPEAYHATLRAHEARAARPGAAPTADGGRRRRRRPRSTTSSWSRRRAWRAASTTTTTSGARASSASWRPDVTPEASSKAAEAELGDFRDGECTSTTSRPGQVSLVARRRRPLGQPLVGRQDVRLAGGRLDPQLDSNWSVTIARPSAARDPPGAGVEPHAAGRWRQPGGLVRRRGGGPPTTARAGDGGGPIACGND